MSIGKKTDIPLHIKLELDIQRCIKSKSWLDDVHQTVFIDRSYNLFNFGNSEENYRCMLGAKSWQINKIQASN